MDRTGVFAGFADLLSELCIYYLVIGVMFMANRGWGLPLPFILLGAAICMAVFMLFLKKPKSVPFLTALTLLLFAAVMYAFQKLSRTPVGFGYGLALALGGGMTVGLSLYNCLNRPTVLRHLSHLDALILAMIMLLLCSESLEVGRGTVGLMTAVLLMDVAAAVGLRMTESGGADGGNNVRATAAAMGAAVLLAFVILFLTAIFSRSGEVTDKVLHAIGAGLSAVGQVIERFVFWLASFVVAEEKYDALDIDMSSSGEMGGYEADMPKIPVDTTVLAVLIGLLILAAAIAVARQLRFKRISCGVKGRAQVSGEELKRGEGILGILWRRFAEAVRFRYSAFIHRDTPAGVLLWLEHRARREHRPRGTGETMRAFLTRSAPDGTLEELAEALDREYYGGERDVLTAKRCRELRRNVKRGSYRREHGTGTFSPTEV